MGFMKPSAPASVETPPPVVAETADTDTQNAYDQKASRRRGLLSTILSRRGSAVGNNSAGTTAQNAESQTTLG